MNIMGHSIQEYLKKINSKLTTYDCLSVSITLLFLIMFAVYIFIWEKETNIPVSYIVDSSDNMLKNKEEDRPFASTNGKTYTFSWCRGESRISDKNKIFFSSENEAKNSGRTLSRLCL